MSTDEHAPLPAPPRRRRPARQLDLESAAGPAAGPGAGAAALLAARAGGRRPRPDRRRGLHAGRAIRPAHGVPRRRLRGVLAQPARAARACGTAAGATGWSPIVREAGYVDPPVLLADALSRRLSRAAPVPPVQALPIILIHGYGCNRGLWLPAARWFAAHGYRVSAISLAPLHCRIDDYVPADRRRSRQGQGGHRRGPGRTGRPQHGRARCARLPAGLRGARRGSCAGGAGHAGHAPLRHPHRPHRRRRERAPDALTNAPWVQAARAPAVLAGRSRSSAICSLQDNIVSRPFEQRLPLAGARAILVRRQGHMSLAASARILAIVDRILRRAASARHWRSPRKRRGYAGKSMKAISVNALSFEPRLER